MNVFANFKFLLLITPKPSHYEPYREVALSFLRPQFRFFSSQSHGFKISESSSSIKLEVGDLSLKGFSLEWNPVEGRLAVETDRFSIYPLMLMPASSGGLWLSNTTEYFSGLEPNFKLSRTALNHFFSHGYLLPGQFFIDGVQKLSGKWTYNFNKPLQAPNCQWQKEICPTFDKAECTADHTLQVFKSSLQGTIEKNKPAEFRFSGGADSRLIAQVGINFLSSLPPFKILSPPSIEPERDLDVQVAVRYCQKNNIDHSVCRLKSSTSYFENSEGRNILSGLYGGDLLGGGWESLLPRSLLEPSLDRTLTIEDEDQLRFELEQRRTLEPYQLELNAQQIFVHSDRAIFFQNVNYGWASPLSNARVSLSPFLVTPFLEQTLRIPQHMRRNYRHFYEFFSLVTGDNPFPVCSYITKFYPELKPPESWGCEPKSQIQKPTKTNRPLQLPIIESVYNFLRKKEIPVDKTRFYENGKFNGHLLCCLSFRSAFPREFPPLINKCEKSLA